MNKVTNFIKTTLAFITGDSALAIATANERKSYATFKAQIGKIEYEIIGAEEQVSDKKEALVRAIHPEERISNGDSYLSGILSAQSSLDAAEAKLAQLISSKEYWTKLMAGEEELVNE